MAEYIDREKAIDLFYPVDPENDGSDGCTVLFQSGNYSSDEIETMLSELPAADVDPVRHGEWMIADTVIENAVCSCCRTHFQSYYQAYSYCPNCGARMDLEEE